MKTKHPEPNYFEHGKIPPQALDLEEAVLGAMMLEKDRLLNVIEILNSDDFYKPEHQIVYSAICDLFGKYKPIDILTVTDHLRGTGELDQVGGAYYIAMLTSKVASSVNIEYHARIIIQKSLQRKLIMFSSDLLKECYEDVTDVFDMIDTFGTRYFQVTEMGLKNRESTMKEMAKEAMTEIKRVQDSPKHLMGISTGYMALDKLTSGLQPSNLVIMASRPGMGKTALALCIARNISETKIPVGIFSLEMSCMELFFRLVAIDSELPGDKIRTGDLSDLNFDRINTHIIKLSDQPIYIDDSPALSVFELRAKARKLKNKYDIQIIFVDYLQLMKGEKSLQGNREREISDISRSLKALSKELQIPVIALAQLSREVEKRPGKKPILSDLRESGSIEQDADIVIFLYREDYYDDNAEQGKTELIIAKNRNGKTGYINLRFLNRSTKFIDYTTDEMLPMRTNFSEPRF